MRFPDLRRYFTADKLPANVFRGLALIVTIVLINSTYGTWQEYLHDKEMFPDGVAEMKASKDKGGEAQPDALQEQITPLWLLAFHATAVAVSILALCAAFVMGQIRSGQILILALLCVGVVLTIIPSDIFLNHERMTESQGGEIPAPAAYIWQLVLTTILFLSPAAVLWAYHASSIMDRYLVRNIVVPMTLCFFGFIAIWLIIDLTDVGRDFITADAGLGQLGVYYLVQMPQMVVMVIPITLLLSVLYALGKMSKANEVISMLGSGLSLYRVVGPILFIGLYCSIIGTVLNYNWAPKAEAHKEAILNALQDSSRDKESRKKDEEWSAVSHMWHNTGIGHERTWYVGRVPLDVVNSPLRYVAIWWEDDDGKMFRSYRADYAMWRDAPDDAEAVTADGWKPIGYWTFRKCFIWEYDEFGTPTMSFFPILEIPDWRETPWHVVSSSLNPEFLGIPELSTYLRTNFDRPPNRLAPYWVYWHYCFAEPFRCFFIAMMAAPLGIVHARRGVMGGVAASIVIFFSLIFFDGVFLTLGRIQQIPAWLAAWGPDFILGVVGGFLLWIRAGNREMFKPKTWFRSLSQNRAKVASPLN